MRSKTLNTSTIIYGAFQWGMKLFPHTRAVIRSLLWWICLNSFQKQQEEEMTDQWDICILFNVSDGLRETLSGNCSTVQTIKPLTGFHRRKCFSLEELKDFLWGIKKMFWQRNYLTGKCSCCMGKIVSLKAVSQDGTLPCFLLMKKLDWHSRGIFRGKGLCAVTAIKSGLHWPPATIWLRFSFYLPI